MGFLTTALKIDARTFCNRPILEYHLIVTPDTAVSVLHQELDRLQHAMMHSPAVSRSEYHGVENLH
jgi:hypothetical protein